MRCIYAAAVARGPNPASVVLDAPVVCRMRGGQAWRPKISGGRFAGPMRLREALVRSRNLVSVRLLDAIGVDYARRYISHFGFEESELPPNLSISLGTPSLTPLSVARGYAAFSNVVAPELAGFQLGTELLIWTALGGRATLLGPVFAAISIDTMSSWLSGALPFLWKLLTGIAFVLVIVLLPRGFAPLVSAVWRRLRPSRASSTPAIKLEQVPVQLMMQSGEGNTLPLRIEHASRKYGSLHVLRDVNMTGNATELLGIIGPNGAGKTTLMRCISDGNERTDGRIYINGVEIGRGSPQHVVGLGVGRSFQNTNLFDTLTVGECLKLARYRLDGVRLFDRSDTVALPQPAMDILRATGLDTKLTEETRNLSHGMKRGLELAMVLATEPSVLLLDEPTAGLTRAERMVIGKVLTRLTRDFALCIVIIEHDLDFVREISNRVVVLHQGAILMEGTVDEVVASDLVKAVYAGHTEKQAA